MVMISQGSCMGLATFGVVQGGSWVLEFTTDGMSPTCNCHLPPLVAFNDMQENKAAQIRHHITAGSLHYSPFTRCRRIQRRYSFYNQSTVGERWQVSICMKRDSEVTKLTKVAERIPDLVNGKPCHRQCLVMAGEYICGLSNESRPIA